MKSKNSKIIIMIMVFDIASTIVVSCLNKNDNNYSDIPNIEVGIENKITTPIFNYSDFVDSVKYVPLETNDSCLIGIISTIRYVNDKLYVSDRNSIFIFNSDGKLVDKISHKGRGRGEYLNLSQYDVNSSNGEISIYDMASKSIDVYSDKGTYLRKVRIENQLPRDFAVFPNGDYLFYTQDLMKGLYHGVWQVDKEGFFKDQLLKLDDGIKYSVLNTRNFIHINDSVIGLLGPVGLDKVIHFTIDGIKKDAYSISTDRVFPKSILKSKGRGLDTKGKIYIKTGYIETEHYLSFSIYDDGEKQVFVHYDKVNDVSYQRTLLIESNEVDPVYTGTNMPIYCNEVTSDRGVVIGKISSATILAVPQYHEVLPSVKSDDNPVIGLYFMK